jgi:glucans biosynthesis protein
VWVTRRRDVLAGLAASGSFGVATRLLAKPLQDSPVSAWDLVRRRAADLAAAAYAPPSGLPPGFPALGYDAYRQLNFRGDQALWRDLGLPFQVQMFHRGGLFRNPVEVFEMAGSVARSIRYSPDQFVFGQQHLEGLDDGFGFAGLRIHAPINVSGRFDEVAAFLGASYFRAVAAGGVYGMSARGLALGSGDPVEEFPRFRAFYVERPSPDASSITLNALLDSPSVAGALRFVITPGASTRFDVTASLFPRVPLTNAGIAPLTSMYLFGPEQPRRFDDFRPQVHDSDGLLMADGMGRRSWRPLTNPDRVQISDFATEGAAGFGLLQRQRGFDTYQDLEAQYDRRPGAWVEPVSGFDAGSVRLVELKARTEGEDNIVAFWRPTEPLSPGVEHRFEYRLTWGAAPAPPSALASVAQWSDGRGDSASRRRFVVDFAPIEAEVLAGLTASVTTTTGSLQHISLQPNAYLGGARLSFEFEPAGAPVSELRAALVQGDRRMSEEWVHRWLI